MIITPSNQSTLLTNRGLSDGPERLARKCSRTGQGRCGSCWGRLPSSCLECGQPDFACELAAGCKAESLTRAALSIWGAKRPQPSITTHVMPGNGRKTKHTCHSGHRQKHQAHMSYLATSDPATSFQVALHEPALHTGHPWHHFRT